MVMTVKGERNPEELGWVALFEHILFAFPGWENDPWVNFDRAQVTEAAVASLKEFKDAGGKTIGDFNGTLLGRDPELLANISSLADVNIVATTGFSGQDFTPGHFLSPRAIRRREILDQQAGITYEVLRLDADYLAKIFYEELTLGMVGPGMMRTGIKAGLVKTGANWDKVTEADEIAIRGAARAAKKAEVAVLTTGISQARRQWEILLEEGIEPDRIVIGRCDDGRAIDLERDKEFARKGTFVSYNHIGWEDASLPYCIPDERRAELVKTMINDGFAQNIILSCDAVCCAISIPQPKHSYSHLLKSFVPRLKKMRVKDSAIDTILRENPKRILGGR
jgi:phosphotriesterase-related protein